MNRRSAFSYVCNACGRCCHSKVITLAPYDVLRIARAAGVSTTEAVRRFTIRRGSMLRFTDSGACTALSGAQCTIHEGRPLACRLYPLGIERGAGHEERFIRLAPAEGSMGIYAQEGTVEDFLEAQDVDQHLEANERYSRLIPRLRERVKAIVDFEKVEPREFWRRATREALAESGYGPNPLIAAMFDPDGLIGIRDDDDETVGVHIAALDARARQSNDGAAIAAAAVMLAVSLGFSPADAIGSL